MNSKRIPEHKLNTTSTAGQVIEQMTKNESKVPTTTGTAEGETHTNEVK